MIIALWVLAGIVFWFVCGYFAAKIEYNMYAGSGEMTPYFLGGPIGLLIVSAVWLDRNPDFWRKFLRIKD